jgi:DNA-binding response OmpR family regulator
MKNILLVEDDEETSKLLKLHFHSHLYNVTSCASGKDALATFEKTYFNLIVLDISLPDMTGLEICKHIRQTGSRVPIIMLTSHDSEASKVLALDLGADDYVTKPFGSLEFMSRVNALLRRTELYNQETRLNKNKLVFKELVIDQDSKSVTLKGERLELTHKEFDLLALLAGSPGKTFSRTELLELIWGTHHEGYAEVVPTLVNRLRNKLKTKDGEPQYILTSWGTGYRFSDI